MTIEFASCDGSCIDPWTCGPHRLDQLFHRYTEGACGLLAIAISERIGHPVRWLSTDVSSHAVVDLEDGRFMDVTGTMTWDELVARWGNAYDVDAWECTGSPWDRPIDVQTERIADELVTLVLAEVHVA